MLATPTLTSAPLNLASDIVDLSTGCRLFFFSPAFAPITRGPFEPKEGRPRIVRVRWTNQPNSCAISNVGHPVEIYSSVYSCPVSSNSTNNSPLRRNEVRETLAITGRISRRDSSLLRAKELIVTISVVDWRFFATKRNIWILHRLKGKKGKHWMRTHRYCVRVCIM